MTKFMLTFAIMALGIASAAPKSYHVTFSNMTWVNGNEIKPGEYKIEIQGDNAILISGKSRIEVPAKMESNDKKFETTSVIVNSAGSQPTVQEIDFGGTTNKLVFPSAMKTKTE